MFYVYFYQTSSFFHSSLVFYVYSYVICICFLYLMNLTTSVMGQWACRRYNKYNTIQIANSQTGPKLEQPTIKCNNSQGSCEWFKHDLEFLWVKLEQICISVESRVFKLVFVWLASHVLPYLSLWVGCRLTTCETLTLFQKYIGINTSNHRKPPKISPIFSSKPCVVFKDSKLEPCAQNIW